MNDCNVKQKKNYKIQSIFTKLPLLKQDIPGRLIWRGLVYGNGSLNNFLRIELNSLACAKP